ncbi:hypothetical protein M8494_10520 [Serratia ureilytica]
MVVENYRTTTLCGAAQGRCAATPSATKAIPLSADAAGAAGRASAPAAGIPRLRCRSLSAFAARLMALLQQWIAQPDLPPPRWQLQTPQEQALDRGGQPHRAGGGRHHLASGDRRSSAGARRNASRCRMPGTASATATCSAALALWVEPVDGGRHSAGGYRRGGVAAFRAPFSLALTAIVQTGAAAAAGHRLPGRTSGLHVWRTLPRLIITESALMPALPRWRRRCCSMLTTAAELPAGLPAGNGDIPPTSCIPPALPGG